MLARITYGLVGLALVTLIAGFFQKSSNALLYVSIVLSIGAIVLVVVGAARRAREAPVVGEGYEAAFEDAGPATMEEELPADLLTPFDEDEELEVEEAFDEGDEGEEVEIVPARRTTTRTSTRKPSGAKAAKPKAGAASAAPAAKVIVVPGRDRYHTGSCRFIQGKAGTEEVSVATAKRRGYQACSACRPG